MAEDRLSCLIDNRPVPVRPTHRDEEKIIVSTAGDIRVLQ